MDLVIDSSIVMIKNFNNFSFIASHSITRLCSVVDTTVAKKKKYISSTMCVLFCAAS